MTVSNNPKPINWRKVAWAGILLVVVAYAYGEPYLEKWTGLDLPSIRENDNSVATLDPPNDSEADSRPDKTAPLGAEIGRGKSDAASKASSNATANKSSSPFLTPTGKKNRLRSPAGLIYGESRGEHRVDHVMRHAVDDKNRPVHSVFKGSKDEILKTIDEAYELVKSKSKRVRSTKDQRLDFRMKHTIDMQRKIGYLGGKRGHRENHPTRSKMTLILDNGKFVVTAYPDN